MKNVSVRLATRSDYAESQYEAERHDALVIATMEWVEVLRTPDFIKIVTHLKTGDFRRTKPV